MKLKKLHHLRPIALAAVGVFLGRGAQADTIIDFDAVPSDQSNKNQVIQTFGDYVSASSEGVTVAGFGTPNIGLTWQGNGQTDTRWDYYEDGGVLWSAGQLNDSAVGAAHEVVFTPNSASASVTVKSFNFHPYYDSSERFTYNVSVLAGANVISGPTLVTFKSDSTKNHAVNLNTTGAPGQELTLRLARVASTLGGARSKGTLMILP